MISDGHRIAFFVLVIVVITAILVKIYRGESLAPPENLKLFNRFDDVRLLLGGGGKFKMTPDELIEHEYPQYLARRRIDYELIKSNALPRWQRAVRAGVESLFLERLNTKEARKSMPIDVYQNFPLDDINAVLFIEHLETVGKRNGIEDAKEIAIHILETINAMADKLPRVPENIEPPSIDDYGFLTYGKFRQRPYLRLTKLIEKFGIKTVTAVLLRYTAAFMGNHHLGLPQYVSDHLYGVLKVTGEGFASPFNSRALAYPNGLYCSMFPDVDPMLGAVGDFFETDLTKFSKRWTINPPYVEHVLERVPPYLTKYLKKEKVFFFVMSPQWPDSASYIALMESPYLLAKIVLESNNHQMESVDGQLFIPYFPTVLFLLSSDPADKSIDIEALKKVLARVDGKGLM